MGSYLEKSMQLFMEQQAQFRQQMGGMLGQTPWAMMNQLTERNLEIWKEFQQNLVGGMGRTAGGTGAGNSGTGAGAGGGKTPRGS
jgi:polyhydroxyalkanoate synthesis regulator protein